MRHHRSPAACFLGVGLGLGLVGCPDRITDAVDCSDPASAGLQGCPCAPDGRCGEGLKCISSVCGEPGIDTLDNASANASEGASASDGAATEGDCTPGAKGCGCVEGTCGLGLRCVDDICEFDDGSSDTSGATSADATEGNGDVCAEQHVDPCYVDGELRECCAPDLQCVGGESVNACEPPCRAHSVCPDCCRWDETILGKYCSPGSELCDGVLCIDTCGSPEQNGLYVGDGECDDFWGWAGCEWGTDCTDCGERVPKEIARSVDAELLRVVAHEYRRHAKEVRVLFDQPVDVATAAALITMFDDQDEELVLDFRKSRVHAFKGIPIPAGHVVIATWKPRADDRPRDLLLHILQDGSADDYRATLPARSRR